MISILTFFKSLPKADQLLSFLSSRDGPLFRRKEEQP